MLDFTAGLAAFWWSHIPCSRLGSFLESFHAALKPGARVVFADNVFVPNSNTPICRTDEEGNTYQLRHLQDGSSHEPACFPELLAAGYLLRVREPDWHQHRMFRTSELPSLNQ